MLPARLAYALNTLADTRTEIIDFLGPVKRQQALDVIDLLISILDNALRDSTKRSINMRSKKIMATCGHELLDPDSGAVVIYLHEAGFIHGVKDFTPRRTFPERPTSFAIDRCSIALDTVRAARSIAWLMGAAQDTPRLVDRIARMDRADEESRSRARSRAHRESKAGDHR